MKVYEILVNVLIIILSGVVSMPRETILESALRRPCGPGLRLVIKSAPKPN